MEREIIEPYWRRELKEVQELSDGNSTKIMLSRIEQLIKGFYSSKNPPTFDDYEEYSNYISRLTMAIYHKAILNNINHDEIFTN